MKWLFSLFLLFPILFANNISAQEEEVTEKIGIYENLDGFIPEDVHFFDIDSNKVNLKSVVDKPTILVLVYYTCPGICSPLLDGVAEVIDKTDLILGEDYQVVTVSFNDVETPSLAKDKRENYLAQIDKEINEDYWMWFTGDSTNIYKLTKQVGFEFKREGKDFIHAATIIALSPKGKITRYLYGTQFNQFDFKMAVIEASKGKSSPTINKFLDYCFSYDAEGKKYVFNITKIAGTIVLAFALIFFLVLILKKKKTDNSK